MNAMIAALALLLPAADPAADTLTVFHDGGAWCWFQDERAIVDRGRLLMGVVAAGRKGDLRSGNVELGIYDFAAAKSSVIELHPGLEQDDHDAPALLVRGDGRYLAVYTKHGGDNLIRYRISERPGDPNSWQPEQIVVRPAGDLFQPLPANQGKRREGPHL